MNIKIAVPITVSCGSQWSDIRQVLAKNGLTLMSEQMVAALLWWARAETDEKWVCDDRLSVNRTSGGFVLCDGMSEYEMSHVAIVRALVDKGPEIERLLSDNQCRGWCRRVCREFLKSEEDIAVVLIDNLLDTKTPLVEATLPGQTIHRHLQSYCRTAVPMSGRDGFVELKTFLDNLRQRDCLFEEGVSRLARGEWLVEPESPQVIRPVLPGWRLKLKRDVDDLVSSFLQVNHLAGQIDPLDLRYQVLFRLTTFHEEEAVSPATIKRSIEEQMAILRHHLQGCTLPLDQVLTPRNVFQGKAWHLEKTGDRWWAVRGAVNSSRRRLAVRFGAVPLAVANQFHRYLHYIHTPRNAEAYGFYVEGEELPFSILAIEGVDREYKKIVLRMFGYDPGCCVEFTRLYNWPGAPRNTSSALFAATMSHLRRERSYIEAAISSFMPAYASGTSMMTGGFQTPIMTKPLQHIFAKTNFGYEHVTRRRMETSGLKPEKIRSCWSLAPTVELLARLRGPSLKPELSENKELIAMKQHE